jgi:S1-C subfamily serine protease
MLDGRNVAEAMAQTRAVIGAAWLPLSEVDAQRCLDKLKAGEPYTDEEWAALDLVVRLMRPAVLTERGSARALPSYGAREPQLAAEWPAFRDRSPAVTRSVGRIDDAAGHHVGTGFVVGPGLILTNRHVLNIISYGTERLTKGATISFHWELDVPANSPPVPIAGVVAVHPDVDLALLRVASSPEPLVRAEVPAGDDDWVVAVGYPGEANPPPVHAAVFMGGLGVRRVSPGIVRDADSRMIAHDCSTMGGSSGSALLALETGEVIGIHYEGRSAYENHAVPIAHAEALLP